DPKGEEAGYGEPLGETRRAEQPGEIIRVRPRADMKGEVRQRVDERGTPADSARRPRPSVPQRPAKRSITIDPLRRKAAGDQIRRDREQRSGDEKNESAHRHTSSDTIRFSSSEPTASIPTARTTSKFPVLVAYRGCMYPGLMIVRRKATTNGMTTSTRAEIRPIAVSDRSFRL